MQVRDRWARLFEAGPGFYAIWLLTVFVLAAVVYPVCTGLYYNNIGRQPDADWVRHLFLRKEVALRLAAPGPKVLITGGSGCLFSLDAAVLEREVQQPTINLCSHAGLGLEYMLARARRHATAGDTVLLALEYRVMSFPDGSQSAVEWNYFTSWDRQHYLEHGIPDAYRMVYKIPFAGIRESEEGWRKLREGYKDQLHYDVTAMTANGNLHQSTGHLEPLVGKIELQFNPPSEYTRKLVADFAGWAKSHGVRVYAVYQAAAIDPRDYWRKTEFFAKLPGWWKQLGIEPLATPERMMWRGQYFMDTIHHSGPGAAYQNALRVAAAMRGGQLPQTQDVLLLPAHPGRGVLPLPERNGAMVDVYSEADEDADRRLRGFLQAGRRVTVSTRALGDLLRARGYAIKTLTAKFTTPAEVMQNNRERIVAICVRPDAPQGFQLDTFHAGEAGAGVWHQGKWALRQGGTRAELVTVAPADLATGEPQNYRFQITATTANCEIQVFERDRYATEAPIRMVVIDPARGIATGTYAFGLDLQAEVRWLGEVVVQ